MILLALQACTVRLCLFEQDPSMFKLPSHSLDVGTTYEFRVDVTDSGSYTSFATQVSLQIRIIDVTPTEVGPVAIALQKKFPA